MSWYEDQLSLGYLTISPAPRGVPQASAPLQAGKWYLTSRWPKHAHTLIPGQDYSYCGRVLWPEDELAQRTGYDLFYWVVEYSETRFPKDTPKLCGPCQEWKSRRQQKGPTVALPTNSPISPSEWAKAIGPSATMAARRLSALASWVADEFNGTILKEGETI